jgi:hypothetical protein
MLATDLIMDVRASRTISADQLYQLEQWILSDGAPTAEQLDVMLLLETYLDWPDPDFAELLSRAMQRASPPVNADSAEPER